MRSLCKRGMEIFSCVESRKSHDVGNGAGSILSSNPGRSLSHIFHTVGFDPLVAHAIAFVGCEKL